jgi:hypothetical protein
MPYRTNVDTGNDPAEWNGLLWRRSNLDWQAAQRLATIDPQVGFFLYFRNAASIPGHGSFQPGDALFFSGSAAPGVLPGCDLYTKDFFATAYVQANDQRLVNVGCYTLGDGREFFDVACVFAANIGWNHVDGGAKLTFNDNVSAALASGDIQALQSKGIVVLLSILNDHVSTGWSEFSNEVDVRNFVAQVVQCVETYGLDGIDIDDEYSAGTPIADSLAWVTTLLRQALPGKIVSKALWQDSQFFQASWNGHGLAENLSFGWEMSYGCDGASRLDPYLRDGMVKAQLAAGVTLDNYDKSSAEALATFIRSNGFGGIMIFDVGTDSGEALSDISNVLWSQQTISDSRCFHQWLPLERSGAMTGIDQAEPTGSE